MTPREEIELMIMSWRVLTGIVLTTLIVWSGAVIAFSLLLWRHLKRRRRHYPHPPPLHHHSLPEKPHRHVRDVMTPVNGRKRR